MTVYGDLETSSLRELPAGRSPISTSVVPAAEKPAWLDRAWQRVREEVTAGHQAYVVCPRIGEEAQAGEDVDERAAPRATASAVRRWPSPTSRRCWSGARCADYASASCTGGCPPTRRTP